MMTVVDIVDDDGDDDTLLGGIPEAAVAPLGVDIMII
jgi:hypothetical protein